MLQRPSAGDETVAIPRAGTDESFIEIAALNKTFVGQDGEAVVALEGLDLNVRRGEFVTIVGPSGCGKSTLLSLVAGLLEATKGGIRIGGTPVVAPYTDLGFVFQSDLLLDWRTVTGNVLLPCVMRGLDQAAHLGRARELLASVGLEGFEGKRPFELSGGMRQRVALCRALLLDPPMLLMDEPFGALDALTREQMQVDLQTIWHRTQKTVLFVTHSISEAVFLSDRVIVMTPRPGAIRAILDIDIERPRDLNVHDTPRFTGIVHEIRLMFQEMGVIHR